MRLVCLLTSIPNRKYLPVTRCFCVCVCVVDVVVAVVCETRRQNDDWDCEWSVCVCLFLRSEHISVHGARLTWHCIWFVICVLVGSYAMTVLSYLKCYRIISSVHANVHRRICNRVVDGDLEKGFVCGRVIEFHVQHVYLENIPTLRLTS